MRTAHIVAVLATAGALGLPGAAPAQAQTSTPVVCTPQSGLPKMVINGGTAAYTYGHNCNNLAGVTQMIEQNSYEVAERPGGARSTPRSTETRYQVSPYMSFTTYAGNEGGYMNARMDLTLKGSFSFGSVSGCGRVDASTVKCTWRSA